MASPPTTPPTQLPPNFSWVSSLMAALLCGQPRRTVDHIDLRRQHVPKENFHERFSLHWGSMGLTTRRETLTNSDQASGLEQTTGQLATLLRLRLCARQQPLRCCERLVALHTSTRQRRISLQKKERNSSQLTNQWFMHISVSVAQERTCGALCAWRVHCLAKRVRAHPKMRTHDLTFAMNSMDPLLPGTGPPSPGPPKISRLFVPPAGPQAVGARTRQLQRSPNAHFRSRPWITTTIPREDPREKKKRKWAGEGKKAKFWAVRRREGPAEEVLRRGGPGGGHWPKNVANMTFAQVALA